MTTTQEKFKHITDWKLLKGSHKFPGPEGGTCINEAAIVAAGFEYRSIDSAADCPPCFSKVIAAYAITLNDIMEDDLRQKLLMPYVTRLAGTADKANVEHLRLRSLFQGIRRLIKQETLMVSSHLGTPLDRVKQAESLYSSLCHRPLETILYDDGISEIIILLVESVYMLYRPELWKFAVDLLGEAILMGNHAELEEATAARALSQAKETAQNNAAMCQTREPSCQSVMS